MLMESNYVVINQIKIELIFDNNVSKTVVMKTDDIVVVSYKKDNTKANIKGRVDSIRYQVNSSLGRIASTIYAKIDGSEEYEGQIVFIKPTDMLDVDVIKTSDTIIDPVCSVSNQDQKITLVRENEVGEFQYSKDGMVWNSPKGPQGLSAYEVVVKLGFEGTEAEWLASLKGIDGISAYDVAVKNGYEGTEKQWLASLHGLDGISAYEVAVENGYVGTQEEWLASLHGISAYEIAVKNGYTDTEEEWLISLKGLDGISAYQVAVENGFTGTQEEWLESLKGISAYQVAVINGFVGTETEWIASLKGEKGEDGIIGVDGKSAYEVAVENGFVGTQEEWLASLKGEKGEDGVIGKDGKSAYDIAVENGFIGTEVEWIASLEGKSAYEVAVINGFVGTEEEWLTSLKGKDGIVGGDGKSAYEIAVENGYTGTIEDWIVSLEGKSAYEVAVDHGYIGIEVEWVASLKGEKGDIGLTGPDGKSAYNIAVEGGYTGTEAEWIASLKGPKGDPGVNGKDGIIGKDGVDGKSAYEVAVEEGFVGTEEEWLASLKGPKGDPDGKSAYEVAVDEGFVGTVDEWLASLKGVGRSAYEEAVSLGYVGTEAQWLASLKGDPGIQGIPGTKGSTPQIDETTKRWFIDGHDTGYVAVPELPPIPTALSQLTNDENFIKNTVDNLINYYDRTQTYTKDEITSLLGNVSTLNVLIVDELPTENISTGVIYLVEVADGVYSQHMYINNQWANLGTTSIDLHNYVTVSTFEAAIATKSNTNHTHAELHTHSNKAVLDTITAESIVKWNNNFSGKYNDLTGKPVIPVVTNDLTNELKAGYDKAALETHTHDNKPALDKISESEEGTILYDGKEISTDTFINDEEISLTKTWSSQKFAGKMEIVNHINMAQKTASTGLTYCLSDIAAQNYVPVVGNVVEFLPKINSGIEYNGTTKRYTLKAGFTYTIESMVRLYRYAGHFYYCLYDFTNSKELTMYGCMEGGPSQNQAIFPTVGIVAPEQDIQVAIRIISLGGDQTNGIMQDTSYLKIEQTAKTVIVDPVNYVNTTGGIEDAPVGSIVQMMGKTAPRHYLICDGSVYNIVNYPHLAEYFRRQFGSYNVYGGDGETTFAVPDARDEFIRGYRGDKTNGISGEPGIHQDATMLPNFWVYGNGTSNVATVDASRGVTTGATNYDIGYKNTDNTRWRADITSNFSSHAATPGPYSYSTRPTNISALICIKCEPTYFMKVDGMIEEVDLWEGEVGTSAAQVKTSYIDLKDSIQNYDKIVLHYRAQTASGGVWYRYGEFTPYDFNLVKNHPLTPVIFFGFGWFDSKSYTNILKTSTDSRLEFEQYESYVSKVVGIKYKTEQDDDNDSTYTDQEIRDYVEDIINGYK